MRSKISERGLVAIICVGLIAIVWFVFGQTIKFPFINFDDPEYVYEVPEINTGLSLHNVKWAFTHWPSPNWFPLKNISHMVEFQFLGSNPGAFHLTNVVLHTIGVVLLFLFLRQMTARVWPSAFVAAVFAIHPLRAESVVWIEERKDVLSGLFFMLTLGAYLHYSRKSSIGRYLTMSILFIAGLLSKSMLVTMPLVLLLLDYWPLHRAQRMEASSQPATPKLGADGWRAVRGLLLEKVPLFVLSAIVAFISSRGIAPAHSSANQLPLLARLGNALVSYVVYIQQMIWPANLAIFYPYPQNGLPIWQPIVAAAILFAITIAVFALRKSHPYLIVGWLWYLVMLLPVIGIIQINLQAHADRYTYLPQIGLLLMIAWAVSDLLKTSNAERPTPNAEVRGDHSMFDVRRSMFGVFCIAIVLALAMTARVQASYWRDSEALWNHTISVTKDNYVAHANLADLLMRRGRGNESIKHSEEVLRIRPNDADGQNNLGLAYLQKGYLTLAAEHLEKALEIDPSHMNAEVNLAWILATARNPYMRNGPRAVHLAEDVARRAGHPNAVLLRALAAAYAETTRFSDAIDIAQYAIALARAIGNEPLAAGLEKDIATYRLNEPLRSGP